MLQKQEISTGLMDHLACMKAYFISNMFVVFRYRLAAGTSEKIQLSSLIAAFQVARDMVTPDS